MSIRDWDEYKEIQKTPHHGFLGDTVAKTQLSLCMYGQERKTVAVLEVRRGTITSVV